MTSTRSFLGMVLAAAATLALTVGAAPAQARDVNWSVGLSSPGVSVGVSNGYPVYVAPAPVYVAPAPVYYAPPPPPPRPVYYAPPRPVYYAPPAPVYYGPPPGHYYREHHRHHRHGRDHWRN